MRRLSLPVLVLAALTVTSSPVLAQALTGSVSGRVVSLDRQPMPGVTVAASSPMLQGVRVAVTSDSGDYLIPLLPPGIYTVSFELQGFQKASRTQQVAPAHDARMDVTMSIAAVSEAVNVVAEAQPLTETAQVATNFTQDLMATLPSNRTIDAVMLMAPSVHATGPRGAFSIDGALSYENLYLLNGGVIVENLRGSPYPLYIEDAIQEVTVATAGVSAEYGRFAGGMISAVTKSGGDLFSGSLRTSFANDYWRTRTPFAGDPKRAGAPNPGTIPTYEATLGGPIRKTQLWFFGAARFRKEETARTTTVTAVPYVRTNDEKRYEGKLTYAPRANHSLQASYTAIDQVQTNFTSQQVMDLQSLALQRQPSDLLSLRYSSILSPNLSVELQYSSRNLSLNTGASTRDRIAGTLLMDGSKNGARYWSPTFCSVCGDEKRGNDDFVGKISYFLSTRSFGAHHLVSGVDRFNDKIFQNAYASGSDYRIQSTSTVIDATKRVFPQFLPNSTLIMYTPVEEATHGSNLRMYSAFFNDAWRVNERFSFNLGLRWDRNDAQDGGGAAVANKALWSPRIAAVWDPQGEGRWALNASYARYVMPMTSNVAASTTGAGNAATYVWMYQGPPVNGDPNGALVTSDLAIQQLFNWFDNNGGTKQKPIGSFVPGFNILIDHSLKSPNADEYAIGTSRRLGARGTVRVDAVWRNYHDFYSQRADLTTGRTTDRLGNLYDKFVVENTNDVKRQYKGLTAQASYRVSDRLDLGGNYTLSRTWGNFDGETTASGPAVAQVNAYPEYKRREWNAPEGDLATDQRHRARLWGTYAAAIPGGGSLTFGLLQQIGSGVPYGAVSLINAAPFVVLAPGYLTPQAPLGGVDYYFTARDAFRTEATYRTDVSINYAYRIRAGRAEPELFFHGEVLNVFRDFQVCGCGGSAFTNGGTTDLTTIGQAVRTPRNTAAGTFQTFNPFAATPVRGTNWDFNTTAGSAFGTALSHLAYTTPRLYRFSVGVRF